MKQTLLMVLAMAAFTLTMDAQGLRFGPTVGFSNNNVTLSGADELVLNGNTDSLRLSIDDGRYGAHFGINARINILGIYIQPGVILSTTGMNYTAEDATNGTVINDIKKETFFNVDIPLLIGYKLGPIRAQGGPVGSFLIANNSDLTSYSAYQEGWEEAYWSFALGGGFDIGKISLDATYEFGLGKYVNEIEFQGGTYQMQTNRNRLVILLTYNLIGN